MSRQKSLNITQFCLEKQVSKQPSHLALIHCKSLKSNPVKYTYREVWQQIMSYASGFERLKLKKFSKVLLRIKDSPDFVFVYFAAMYVGLVPIMTSSKLSESEVQAIIKDSNPKLIVYSKESRIKGKYPSIELAKLYSKNQDAKPRLTQPTDPAFLVYTSGTTSRPKGVLHGHKMILSRVSIRKDFLDLNPKDHVLHTDALFFTYTMGTQFLDAWASGATSILYTGKVEKGVWSKLIKKFSITVFVSTPSTFQYIIESKPRRQVFKSLRHSITAGDVLKTEIEKKWKVLTQKPLYQGIGMTEMNLFISTGPHVKSKKGALGKVLPNRKVVILPLKKGNAPLKGEAKGLLAVDPKDNGLMLKYLKKTKATQAFFRGKWFLTQDIVTRDKEGYYYFEGRIGNIINVEADLVSPEEVEKVFENHPKIKELACWKSPGDQEIDQVTLYVVPLKKEGVTSNELIKMGQKKLIDYKQPKKIIFVSKLPRSPRGKIIRSKLGYKNQT